MLCRLLVTWTSRPLIYLGSYGCCPGLPLVPMASPPLSRSTSALLCRLAHNDSRLWRDGRSTSLPLPAVASLLHIPILGLMVCYIWCRTLPLSAGLRRRAALASSLAPLATAALLSSTSSWASGHLSGQCSISGQLEGLAQAFWPSLGHQHRLVLGKTPNEHLQHHVSSYVSTLSNSASKRQMKSCVDSSFLCLMFIKEAIAASALFVFLNRPIS